MINTWFWRIRAWFIVIVPDSQLYTRTNEGSIIVWERIYKKNLKTKRMMLMADSWKRIIFLIWTPISHASGIIGRWPFQHLHPGINICANVVKEKGRADEFLNCSPQHSWICFLGWFQFTGARPHTNWKNYFLNIRCHLQRLLWRAELFQPAARNCFY